MYNWKAKEISCILFDSYSSFKLMGTHEHDKVMNNKSYAFIFLSSLLTICGFCHMSCGQAN